MKTSTFLKTALILGCILHLPLAAAITLNLPQGKTQFLKNLRKSCPACVKHGVKPCGAQEITSGKKFASTFFHGTPSRGYLLAGLPNREKFEKLFLSKSPLEMIEKAAKALTQDILLIRVDAEFSDFRVIGKPTSQHLNYSPAAYACHRGQDPKIKCPDTGQFCETCSKTYGQPHLVSTWEDGAAGTVVKFTFTPTLGDSGLAEIGTKEIQFYCLVDTDATFRE
jgi:hypothetical protein